MGKDTRIEWCNHTWNCWIGCTKVSAGCANCYAYRDMTAYGHDPSTVRRTSDKTFFAPLRWRNKALVFVCSWSDFFHEAADGWRADAWRVIRQTPHLTYQVLTKRPERIAACLPDDWGKGWANVWLGVTAENQAMANERIPVLLKIPAVLRFISCEPLLGSVDLAQAVPCGYYCDSAIGHVDHQFALESKGDGRGIGWVIIGGESGDKEVRLMAAGWAMQLIDQCKCERIPCFFKQAGTVLAKMWNCQDRKGSKLEEWPPVFRVREFPIMEATP